MDWGYAPEYAEAMWLMLQQNKPDDYVVATGEVHSVREFVEAAFQKVGIDIVWSGKGIDEIGIDKSSSKTLVRIKPEFFRPAEVDFLQGDYSKAKNKLGWSPKTDLKELIGIMIENNLVLEEKENKLYQHKV